MNHNQDFITLCESALHSVREVTWNDAAHWLQEESATLLIDVREDHEWEQGRIPCALHIGRGILERDIAKHCPDKSSRLLLYCGGGYRSALAAESLQAMGYNNVYSLQGGFRAWKQSYCS